MELTVRTFGGPFHGDEKEVPTTVLGWPPPVRLPGVFHGGGYIRRDGPVAEGATVVEYEWREILAEHLVA